MSSFGEAWAAVADIEGWMTEGQGRALFEAASGCPPRGRIVEIGSFRGRSTIVLALSAPHDASIFAIDPHAGTDRGPREIEGYEREATTDHAAFWSNIERAGLASRVTHLPMFSHRALDEFEGTVDVLYIDGAHRYRPARADIRDWGARVADGGAMLIHDSFSSIGVTRAILRELVLGRRFRYVGRSRSLAIYRADLGGRRLLNASKQLLQLAWFARNVVVKALLTLGLGGLVRRLGRRAPEWPY